MKLLHPNKSTYADLIFERRNKQYGAYELRTHYEARLLRAFLIGCILASLAVFVPQLVRRLFPSPVPGMRTRLQDRVFMTDPKIYFPPASLPSVRPATSTGVKQIAKPIDPLSFKPVVRIPTTPDPDPVPDPGPSNPDPGPLAGTGTTTGPATTTGPLPIGGPPPAIFSQASVDVAPDFPGGIEAFYKFFRSKLRYTPQARMEGLSGRYFVQFVVGQDGRVRDLVFLKPIGFGMEAEIEKVLAACPAWTPGRYAGESVSTAMVLPVNFSLLGQ